MKIEVCTIAEFCKRRYEGHFDVLKNCTEYPKENCSLIVAGKEDGTFAKPFDFDTVEWKELKSFVDKLRDVVSPESKVIVEYQ